MKTKVVRHDVPDKDLLSQAAAIVAAVKARADVLPVLSEVARNQMEAAIRATGVAAARLDAADKFAEVFGAARDVYVASYYFHTFGGSK